MPRNYYCLVAGLPNISFEDSKLSYSSGDFLADLREFVQKKDFKYFKLFKFKTDNENIYKVLVDHEHKFISGGSYSSDEIDEFIEDPANAVSFIREYIEEYHSEEFDEEVDKKRLTILYYQYLLDCRNDFVKGWFELELNIKNIFAALNSRKYGLQTEKEIIDVNNVSEAIAKSNSRDFGLTGELEYIEQLLSVYEIDDLLKREKAIDLLKWDWLDENSFFNYFTVEKLFAYFIKLTMIERWIKLDPKTGRELFNRFMKELEKGYQFPDEFKKIKN
ncbi:MAG: DUF2764 domain-containing protein [Candidatus Delongbacteria bacterium]|nr:DUF2764 domain-containing protein [Candidatus Delongbacteria bacterium]